MPAELLWIVKDINSDRLSQSAQAESSRIRKHVQVHRHERRGGRPFNERLNQTRVLQKAGQIDEHSNRKRCDFLFTALPVSLKLSNQNLTEAEARNMDFYMHRTACEWSGWQDDYFWKTLVIQACVLNPSITHALISMATWHRLCSLPRGSEEANQLSDVRSSQWMKALGSSHRAPFRTYAAALIQCVVMVCLQQHRGDFQDYRLLRSANAMMEELNEFEGTTECQNLKSERELINGTVRPLLERLEARRCTMGDLPAALLRSAEMRRSRMLSRCELKLIPDMFTNLRQARDCLEDVLIWGQDQIPAFGDQHRDGSFFEHCLRHYVQCWQTATIATALTEEISQRDVNLLRLAAIHGMVLLITCTADNETSFDLYISDFREMVNILAQLESSNDYRGRMSFGIDSGLINIVSLIGTRCRDPHLRSFAEHWLQTSFRMEGDRPSLLCAHIIRAWTDLEEREETIHCCDDIPEWRRYKLLRGARYHAQQLIRLDFVAAPYDIAAGATVTEVWISEVDGRQNLLVSSNQLGLPDVFIEACNAAFLEGEKRGTYHNVPVTNFFFPIPRT